MKIGIADRAGIEELCSRTLSKKLAVISITDFGAPQAEMVFKPEHLLRLSFNDIPLGKDLEEEFFRALSPEEIRNLEIEHHAMSEEQIAQVVEFYNLIKDKADAVICQCEHGQSRSAAVAAALTQFVNGDGIEIFADSRYCPNKSIYRALIQKLKENVNE